MALNKPYFVSNFKRWWVFLLFINIDFIFVLSFFKIRNNFFMESLHLYCIVFNRRIRNIIFNMESVKFRKLSIICSFFSLIFFEHGIKCAIIVSLLTITRIESNDLDIDKSIIKSNDIEVYGANGIGKG